MAEYTPNTEDVREAYAGYAWLGPGRSDVTPEFDRWLAAHDAQVLRDAALSGDYGTTAQSALLARADRIAGGTSHE